MYLAGYLTPRLIHSFCASAGVPDRSGADNAVSGNSNSSTRKRYRTTRFVVAFTQVLPLVSLECDSLCVIGMHHPNGGAPLYQMRSIKNCVNKVIVSFLLYMFVTHSLTHSLTEPLTHSTIHSPTRSYIHSITQQFTHSLIHSTTLPLIQSVKHLLTHSSSHSLINSPIH